MHDASRVPALVQYFIFYGIAGLIGLLHAMWRAVPNASNLKSLGDPPRRSFEMAFWQARRDEIVRLAHQHEPTVVPGLVRPGVEDQPILSMPVSLYESRPTRWHSPATIVTYGARNRAYRKRSATRVAISPVDHGTLHLTRQRFIFASAMRQREFPLDELTHFTATKSGIALATRGDGAISWIRGINATSIRFEVVPGAADTFPTVQCVFDVTGHEIREIVHLLLSASTPAPA